MKVGDRVSDERGLWIVVGTGAGGRRLLVKQGSLAHLVIASRDPEVSYP